MYNSKIVTSGSIVELYKANNYIIRSSYKEDKKIEELNQEDKMEDIEEKEPKKQSKRDRLKTLNDSRNNITKLIKANEYTEKS